MIIVTRITITTVLKRDPIALEIQNPGFPNQVPTLAGVTLASGYETHKRLHRTCGNLHKQTFCAYQVESRSNPGSCTRI